MIYGTDESSRLQEARDLFERTLEDLDLPYQHMSEQISFAMGRQWESDAKSWLDSMGLPSLTFNLISPIVRELIGANEDARRKPRVAPAGTNDLPAARILNSLVDRFREQGEFADAETEVFERALISGVGWGVFEVDPDEDDPLDVQMRLVPVTSLEILYDTSSVRRNMSDAKYYCHSRWMHESEFKAAYPEHAEDFAGLVDGTDWGKQPPPLARIESSQRTPESYSTLLRDPRYFRQRDHEVRVIRIEYTASVKRYYAIDPRTDSYTSITKKTYDALSLTKVAQVVEMWGSETRWFDFIGSMVLYDGDSLSPHSGFTIMPCLCYRDHENYEPYGITRDLMDPQRELNKRYSEELTLLHMIVQPGVVYDRDAFGPDKRAVERKLRQPGFSLEKEPGREVMFRDPPATPPAVDHLITRSQSLLQMIAGVSPETLVSQQSGVEPVGTAYLRYRRSILAITGLLQNYRSFQKLVLRAMVETIREAVSDDQLQRMLGDDQRFQVRGGVIIDLQAKQQIAIRDIRTFEYQLEFDSSADNTTQQMLENQLYMALSQAGIPLDPEVLIDNLPTSREAKERMKLYAAQAREQAAQAQQADSEAARRQVEGLLQIEASKVMSRARSEQEKRSVEMASAQLDFVGKTMDAKATAVDANKKRSIEMLRAMLDFIATNEQLTLDAITSSREDEAGIPRPSTPAAFGGGRLGPATYTNGG